MNEEVKNFIKENITLIQSKKWEEIYEKDLPEGFTETILNCGVNPLELGLNYIPKKFLKYSKIEKFIIPDNVTNISNGAFVCCKSLTSIEIADNVTSIGESAFYKCLSLTSITIPDSVTNIGDSAFAYCDNLTKVNYTGTIDQWVQIKFSNSASNPLYQGGGLYIGGELVTELVIPNSVINIGNSAFFDCRSLINVVIPDSVTSIGDWAFCNCRSLKSIEYNGTKEQWRKIVKGHHWDMLVPATSIICTNGVIEL